MPLAGELKKDEFVKAVMATRQGKAKAMAMQMEQQQQQQGRQNGQPGAETDGAPPRRRRPTHATTRSRPRPTRCSSTR